MKKHLGMVVLAALVVLSLVVYSVAYQVDELSDIVVVTTFGKIADVVTGRDPNQAGLKFKWLYPVQETVRYESTTYLFEDTSDQVQTQDGQNILLTLFCAWRIDDPAKLFRSIRKVEGADGAQERVREILRDAKQEVVGRAKLADLINTDSSKMKLEAVEQEILQIVQQRLHSDPGTSAARDKGADPNARPSGGGIDYGIEVVMVGVKSLGLPESITESVIDSMRAERNAKAQEYESGGNSRATAIVERARTAAELVTSFARRKAQEIRAEGDAAAAQYYSEFQENEGLARFLRSLEDLKEELRSHTVILLDGTKLPGLKFLTEPPTVESIRNLSVTTRPTEKPAEQPGK
jgi:membrane protease subunit HflC